MLPSIIRKLRDLPEGQSNAVMAMLIAAGMLIEHGPDHRCSIMDDMARLLIEQMTHLLDEPERDVFMLAVSLGQAYGIFRAMTEFSRDEILARVVAGIHHTEIIDRHKATEDEEGVDPTDLPGSFGEFFANKDE